MGTHLILFSIVTLSLYNVLLKRFPQKLILLFWVSLLSYVGFVAIYLLQSIIIQHDHTAIHELIFSYTLEDIPLYIIIACSFVGSMIISEKLLDGYDLSLVIPLSQFGLLGASVGYIVLGDPFEWSLVVGIAILCLGTAILSLSVTGQSLSLSMFSGLKNIPRTLWVLVALQAVCSPFPLWSVTREPSSTAETEMIMNSVKRLHLGPIAFHGAFYFNIGQQLYSVLIFLAYLLSQKPLSHKNLLTTDDQCSVRRPCGIGLYRGRICVFYRLHDYHGNHHSTGLGQYVHSLDPVPVFSPVKGTN